MQFKQEWNIGSWKNDGCKRQNQRHASTLKHNIDKRIRRNNEEVNSGDQVYIRVDRKDENETRQNIALIVDGVFHVTNVDSQSETVVLEHPNYTA